MGKTLFQKVWDAHTVKVLPSGRTQLFIETHYIHEVTSPQAFGMLHDLGLKVAHPERTFANVDHVIPTTSIAEPLKDAVAQSMLSELRKNCKENGIKFFDTNSGCQGIVHVVGPEQGITQPGQTICCGDSHTATHGAFGAVAFGIGTTQVRDVLATQTLGFTPLKVRRINVNGKLGNGVTAKDVALHLIRLLGVAGGIGYAHEYGGEVFDNFSMEERMTVCNMAIEGGARVGYVNPDETTFAYLKGRPYAPSAERWDAAVERWRSYASDPDCVYDDVINVDAAEIAPTVTWGITPAQNAAITGTFPRPETMSEEDAAIAREAYAYTRFVAGTPIAGTLIDVAFIGSCTNGRLSDFESAAAFLKGKKVAAGVKAIAAPGSQVVAKQCIERGLDKIFTEAGFEWRLAGCSMCLAMNPDKLEGDQVCASSSNRNFKGRQGSPTGRTILMSPVMVAAAAVAGKLVDCRQ